MSEDNSAKFPQGEILRMTAEVVSAYVSNNLLPATQIADTIKSVYGSLNALESGLGEVKREPLKPAVPIRRSVTPDFIICLDDGKKLKMLKRHIRTAYNLTPEEYRERWGLAPDYPMVAPNYTKQRRRLAKQIGLGTRTRRRRR